MASTDFTPWYRDERFPQNLPPRERQSLRVDDIPQDSELKGCGLRHTPQQGPPLKGWHVALIGRQQIKETAANPIGSNDTVTSTSVRAVLVNCIEKAEKTRALSRLPLEVALGIERILYDSVSSALLLKFSMASCLRVSANANRLQ